MKLCDITQFYSPRSGGVKRYLHEKIAYLQQATTDEHVLIVPGKTNECAISQRARTYFIRSPLVSRTGRYRALINLGAVDEIFARERPDLIECGDPYQLAWRTIRAGRKLRIPVVGFYHSHFVEAYFGGAARLFGKRACGRLLAWAREYVCQLYNSFELTIVPSQWLADQLKKWGVQRLEVVNLGVNTSVFFPDPADAAATRVQLGIPKSCHLLLYVGRLGPEKNVVTLLRAFELLDKSAGFRLLVIGDGPQRKQLRRPMAMVTWLPYCSHPNDLAHFYRAADLFVQPSTEETFGLAAAEAQACGTPVIGIRGSRMATVADQQGWAETNTPESLGQAITAAFAGDLGRLGEQAREYVATRYSWRCTFERLFSIYREVCTSYTKRS